MKNKLESFYRTFHSKTVSIKMAKKFAIRIPGMRKSLSRNQMLLGGLAILGGAALYFITMSKQTGFPIIDTTLGQLGDITGLEGRFAPPAAVPVSAPMGEAGYGDWRFTNAYPGTVENYDEFRFSGAYKNE